jgi:CRP/FNR family transcriptional regulator, cyclic AMP receptor protein
MVEVTEAASGGLRRAIVSPRNNKSKFTAKLRPEHVFDVQASLESAGVARKIVQFQKSQKIYSQGEPAAGVMYIQEGGVKLAVVNEVGKEAVVAILGPSDFVGEGCLAGQAVRMGTATAITPTTVLVIGKTEMMRALHAEHALPDRFLSHMLSRTIRIEEDLVDQLFNSSEKRLARTLLLLAMAGNPSPKRCFPKYRRKCWQK